MPAESLDLRDIHLPDPVSWWPPAIGWWFVLLGLILFVMSGLWAWRRWKNNRNSAKRLALTELDRLKHQYQQQNDPARLMEGLSTLLRRAAISVYPREQCAGLTGTAWLQFLDTIMQDTRFTNGPGSVLIAAPYAKEQKLNADELISLCKDWIEALP